MLKITIPAAELFDEETERIIKIKEQTLVLEHSLVSISKWESIHKVPFLSKETKTTEQTIDYIRCMTLTQNVDPKVYNFLTPKNVEDIGAYIQDPMTATTFPHEKPKNGESVPTSELIYCWMITLTIPVDFDKWHINRLLTLINVVNIMNDPKKKKMMTQAQIHAQNRELNKKRREALGSKG
jgi:hypothetical protein